MELICSLKSFSWQDTTMNKRFIFLFFLFEWTDQLGYNQAISSSAQPVKNMICPCTPMQSVPTMKVQGFHIWWPVTAWVCDEAVAVCLLCLCKPWTKWNDTAGLDEGIV